MKIEELVSVCREALPKIQELRNMIEQYCLNRIKTDPTWRGNGEDHYFFSGRPHLEDFRLEGEDVVAVLAYKGNSPVEYTFSISDL